MARAVCPCGPPGRTEMAGQEKKKGRKTAGTTARGGWQAHVADSRQVRIREDAGPVDRRDGRRFARAGAGCLDGLGSMPEEGRRRHVVNFLALPPRFFIARNFEGSQCIQVLPAPAVMMAWNNPCRALGWAEAAPAEVRPSTRNSSEALRGGSWLGLQ